MLWHRPVFLAVFGLFEGFFNQGGGRAGGGQPRPVHGPPAAASGQGKWLSMPPTGGGRRPRSPSGDPADRRIGLCFVILARRAPASTPALERTLQNERSELKCSGYTSSKTATLAG